MYRMNKKQELNAFIKECITDALVKQMETHRLSEITITDIVKKAGVSRASFYRNFGSKQDVLENRLKILIEEWGKDFEARGDMEYFSESLLKHYYKHKNFYLLLHRQGLSGMIYENLRTACKIDESQNNIERYTKSLVSGSIFGWVDEWMRRGMNETPEEIIKLTSKSQSASP